MQWHHVLAECQQRSLQPTMQTKCPPQPAEACLESSNAVRDGVKHDMLLQSLYPGLPYAVSYGVLGNNTAC